MGTITDLDQNVDQDFPWALAATAGERLSARRPAAAGGYPRRSRIDWWTEMAAFSGADTDLDERLAPLGMTEAQLRCLLGESADDLAARLGDPPPWFTWFIAAWRRGTSARLPEDLGLLEVTRPLLAAAADQLRSALAGLPACVAELGPLVELLCARPPLVALDAGLGPTMVLELNVARVEGRLAGDTPQQRLACFIDQLRDSRAALALWREYPVLARYTVEVLTAWVRSRASFARRLVVDLPLLRDTIWAGAAPGVLSGVEFGAGDTHRGGHSVAIVRFNHAGVVYKPRSLGVDQAFQRVLDWFNEHSPCYELRGPHSADRGEYGWSELIEPASCTAEDELAAFYWRAGAQLSLLYALRATDFHAENLIAASEHPVLVDLEAMLHPGELHTGMIDLPDTSGDPAERALWDSVLATGLLPAKTIVADPETGESFATDISGIGGGEIQRSFVRVPVLADAGTDKMRLVTRHAEMPGTDNRPQLADGPLAEVGAYRNELIEGFRFGYELICRHRPDFLGPDGLLASFTRVRTRIIPRPTYLYAQVLTDSLHPDFLRDGLDRERCLARMCEGWTGMPAREQMIAAEIRALSRGDLPVFEARPATREVWLDDGTRIEHVLARPPLDWAAERITAMGPRDLELQQQVILGSHADARPDPAPVRTPRRQPAHPGAGARRHPGQRRHPGHRRR